MVDVQPAAEAEQFLDRGLVMLLKRAGHAAPPVPAVTSRGISRAKAGVEHFVAFDPPGRFQASSPAILSSSQNRSCRNIGCIRAVMGLCSLWLLLRCHGRDDASRSDR